ncbi:hypothetical protein ABB37_03392 [Leptomonas pyrrhocoris]|uniref:Uncharacterized protein n=1 Tax=Leptomonas pyrrhocoris TaxID=157538 RepID=A0A0M9G4V6_LEPPY|nr:hypothetical protein ABB37_03392 [Leptomonas pyrrhocoris]KPA82287.1 hypothetical protein ABB37_03392 [Leptomonas pyrrhocoris]|eukprot:XP_015660726.1 hypothetical protein ABB37_03392 [Leptomonas pyrrhocoris]
MWQKATLLSGATLRNGERADYAARCNFIREERHLRALLRGEEEQAWRDACDAWSASHRTLCRHEENERIRQAAASKEHYSIQLYRNPNSPMPTLDPINGLLLYDGLQSHSFLSASASCSPPLARELSDLLLWEWENRVDLEAWESGERRAMTVVMGCIVAKHYSREHKGQERTCEAALNGATVLEWNSYPSYAV